VDGGKFRGGALRQGAALLQIGGHVVEGADEIAKFLRGRDGHAGPVLPLANFIHGVGQRFYRAGDLLGEKKREPTAGKENQSGEHEQLKKIRGADAVPLAVERPVLVCSGAQLAGGGAESGGHGKANHHESALWKRGLAHGVLGATDTEDWAIPALGGVQDSDSEWFGGRSVAAVVVVEPGADCGRLRRIGQLIFRYRY